MKLDRRPVKEQVKSGFLIAGKLVAAFCIAATVLNCTGAQASTVHFTGQMRHAETNLSEFPARYYSSTQGPHSG